MKQYFALEYDEPNDGLYHYVADDNGYRTYDPSKALRFDDIISAAKKLLQLGLTGVHVQSMLTNEDEIEAAKKQREAENGCVA